MKSACGPREHSESAPAARAKARRSAEASGGGTPRAVIKVCAVAISAALLIAATAPAEPLTEAPRLSAVYDSILDARFDRADGQLKQACPPAPVEACQSLRVESLWWQILINPESRADDKRFQDLALQAIAANDAWTRREPRRAEAWFYLAGSHAPLVQWRVLRGERLAAAREGAAIKAALEHALELDPALNDAYFGIGVYHYYADIAPAAAKVLRWLLFLPGGDRVKGLQEMLQARDRGELLRGEADYQLQLIYLWYEHNTDLALTMLDKLDARYPNNPLFRQSIADARETYLRDHQGSAAAWRQLLARATAGTVYDAQTTVVRARLGLASTLITMNQLDAANEQLTIVIGQHPIAPIGAKTRAEQLQRALQTKSATR